MAIVDHDGSNGFPADRHDEVGFDHLVIDLDGTLVRTDVFLEACFTRLRKTPLFFFRLLLWLVRGRAFAKARVAELVDFDAADLPYEPAVVEYIERQRQRGKTIVLATGAPAKYAARVAEYLGLFDHVIASDAKLNMKGIHKLTEVQRHLGSGRFAYAGNSAADRPIWRQAALQVFVNAPARDVARSRTSGTPSRVLVERPPVWRGFVREMRVHQWAKNLLVFVPLLTAHAYASPETVIDSVLAFLCFSLCASGAYFINDLLDLRADRKHRAKRSRPLASGSLPIEFGLLGAIALPTLGLVAAAALLPLEFAAVLLGYLLLTNAYSLLIKRLTAIDLVTLAVLYTLRIIGGGLAIHAEVSSWLLAFSVFLFMSLACMKRYIEISALPADSVEKSVGRAYTRDDRETVFALGIANITVAIVVLALYLDANGVAQGYKSPNLLWLLCVLMLYWSSRVWLFARRGKIADDPVVFAIKDRVSLVTGVAFVAVEVAAKHLDLSHFEFLR